MNRWLAGAVSIVAAAVGAVVVSSPASAGVKPEITGVAVCDEASSSWQVTWTIANTTETPVAISLVKPFPAAPISTLTGVKRGDILPAASAGTLTATSTVYSLGPGEVYLNVNLADDAVYGYRGEVKLPRVCGDPVMPVATFQSRCDDLLVTVGMPAGGLHVPAEIWSDGRFFQSLDLEPGAPAQSVSVPAAKTGVVKVIIDNFDPIGSGEWEYPAADCMHSLGTSQLFARVNSAMSARSSRACSTPATRAATRHVPSSSFSISDLATSPSARCRTSGS
ncbi:hypothetical protein DFJ67_1833 [Asanoa ferruginea]|uniref:Cellulose binding domain-containing protein n=2 Tax=Asanoa ferruginea TaxID=53367 RepID=A0A3D9ZQE8_9ACTN|nr:hypothetical protein DFJ67_1833 [Asanoa ferruginea]